MNCISVILSAFILFTSSRNLYSFQFKSSNINRNSYHLPAVPKETFLPTQNEISSIVKVTAISAPLGVLLDNQHGLFNVLNYFSMNIQLQYEDVYILKTAIWVPFLFAFAGFIMSYIILIADKLLNTDNFIRNPSWSKVFYGISLFSGQYYLSGALDYLEINSITINLILSIIAIIGFLYFDGTVAGVILAILTAISGPAAELFIINFFHFYIYSHADYYGICTWIPSVYFLGGPAVGNLARKFANTDKLNNAE